MANVNLIGGPYQPIVAAAAQSGAPAESLLLERLAQVNRFLEEWTFGARISGMPPVAPPTPMFGTRLPGHDHSGGMMGKPQKRTVWSAVYGGAANSFTTELLAPNTRVGTGDEGDGPNKLIDAVVRGVFIPGGKVHAKLDFEVHLKAATSDTTYGVKVWGPTLGPYTATGTLTGGTYQSITVQGVPFVPGILQSFRYSVFITRIAGAGPHTVYLCSAALHQTSTSV